MDNEHCCRATFEEFKRCGKDADNLVQLVCTLVEMERQGFITRAEKFSLLYLFLNEQSMRVLLVVHLFNTDKQKNEKIIHSYVSWLMSEISIIPSG